jgi:hypothetical protein
MSEETESATVTETEGQEPLPVVPPDLPASGEVKSEESATVTETEGQEPLPVVPPDLPASGEVKSEESATAEQAAPEPVGNPDMWELLCSRTSNENEFSATYALEVPAIGCVLRLRLVSDYAIVSETSVFVPGASIARDVNGGKKLVHPADR